MPSCINYIIGNWCTQKVSLWIPNKFSFRKKFYHLTITASLLCLIVIRNCVSQVLGCAFLLQGCVFRLLSCVLSLLQWKLCFCTKTLTSKICEAIMKLVLKHNCSRFCDLGRIPGLSGSSVFLRFSFLSDNCVVEHPVTDVSQRVFQLNRVDRMFI